MAAHRYWRFRNSTGSNNGNYFSCTRIDFYPNSHEANNVAPLATATASGFLAAGYEPSKAINGTNSNMFFSGSTANGWLELDFGAGNAYDLDHFDWAIEPTSTASGPKDLQIEWSNDGASWTLAWAANGLTWTSVGETKNFTNPSPPTRNPSTGSHRYWRLLVHATGASPWCSIGELVGRAVAGGGQALTGGTASASSTYDPAYPAANAVNGVLDAGWVSGSFDDGCWWKYDLGAGVAKEIPQIDIYARSDTGFNQSPISFDWQWSDDNATFHTKFHGFFTPFATASQEKTAPAVFIGGATRRRQLLCS